MKAVSFFKHIIKRIFKRFSNSYTVSFYPMCYLPPKLKNENFSDLVLVYDKRDSSYYSLGYYDYEAKEWRTLDEEEMFLGHWCFVPIREKGI